MIHANTDYGEVVKLYRAAGWPSVLPLPPGQKMPPPSGFTGHQAPDPTEAQMDAWAAQRPDANVALRMPADLMGLDVDAYGEKKGGLTLAAAEGQWGPLPPTWRSTSRPDDAVSGIRYFRVPPGTVLPGTLEMGANGTRTGDIEIIQRHHRFAVVAPSLHPQQRRYVWFRPDGTQAAENEVPRPEDLPDLPQTWLTGLLAQRSGGDPTALLEALPAGELCTKMQEFRRKAVDACQGASRHDNVNHRVLAIVRLGEQGHPGAATILDEVRGAFAQAVASDRQGGHPEAVDEFDRMLLGAAKIVAASPTPGPRRGCSCGLVPDNGMSDAHLTTLQVAKRHGCHAIGYCSSPNVRRSARRRRERAPRSPAGLPVRANPFPVRSAMPWANSRTARSRRCSREPRSQRPAPRKPLLEHLDKTLMSWVNRQNCSAVNDHID